MYKPFSSVFPNPHRASEAFTEEQAKRAIDALLAYRRKEVLAFLACAWGVFLLMVFSFLATIRFAFSLF